MTKQQYDRLVKIEEELMQLYRELKEKNCAVDILLASCDIGFIRYKINEGEYKR